MKPDVVFLVVQSLIVMAVGLAPLVIIALLVKPGVRALLAIAAAYALSSAGLSVLIWMEAGEMNACQGNQIGPSWCSIREELIPILMWTVWLPATIAGGILLCFRRLRTHSLLWNRFSVSVFVAALLAGGWVAFLCKMLEFTHEDTVWAHDFSLAGWKQIEEGMPQNTVYEIIGKPLGRDQEDSIQLGKGFAENGIAPELWASHLSAGWIAAIWFTNDVVKKRSIWYLD